MDATGNAISILKYTAYGELRTGTSTTDYQYTGQRSEVEVGLYFYVSRFYDPQLARFISADTIVPEPGSIKGYDRYAYVNGRGLCTPERSERGNPINYSDPSGHRLWDGITGDTGTGGDYDSYAYTVYYELHTEQERQENQQTLEKVVDVTTTIVGVLNEPADWAISAAYCASGDCSPWLLMGLLPLIPSSFGNHIDDVIDVGKKAPIVIGENMYERVIPFAKQIGGSYYKPWKIDPFDLDLSLKRNERWIRDMVKEGRDIIDIGVDPSRINRSIFYEMETRVLEGLRYGVTKLGIQK